MSALIYEVECPECGEMVEHFQCPGCSWRRAKWRGEFTTIAMPGEDDLSVAGWLMVKGAWQWWEEVPVDCMVVLSDDHGWMDGGGEGIMGVSSGIEVLGKNL